MLSPPRETCGSIFPRTWRRKPVSRKENLPSWNVLQAASLKKKKKKVICLGNIISAKAIQGLIVKMTSQLHTAFHPQDSKRGLKSEILSTCTQTHTFGRIHTYVTLFTSLMKVECTGRCLPAAHHSPSSSLRQEAKDTRSKRNCRENPGR